MKTTNKTSSVTFLNRSLISLSLIVLAIVFVFSLASFNSEIDCKSNSVLMQGVVFEIEVTDHEHSPPTMSSMEAVVEGKNLSMEILPDGDGNKKGKMIFRGNRGKNGEVVLVDNDKEEYYVMNDAFVDSMLERVDQSKSMMDEALKSLTKEQRDMIEKMQKQEGANIPGLMQPQSKPKLTKTGESGTKMGYPCVKYEVHLDGVKTRELWTTDWSNIDGGDEARIAFGGMNSFFERITDKMGDMAGGSDFYEEMNFKNGFPVVTKNFNEDSGELEDESSLRGIRRQQIDPDEFEPPSGYKRREMFQN